MSAQFTPATFLIGFCMGSLAAYLAHKRGLNPYTWFAIGFFFSLLGALAIFFIPRQKKNQPLTSSATPKPAPIPTISGPRNKFWYYLDAAHQQIGPMSYSALTTAWKQKKIALTTYVWNEELPNWKFLKDLVKIEVPPQNNGT